MSHYVVMVNGEQFLKLRELQEEIGRIPDGPEPIVLDAWASCEACGEDCEYGEPVKLEGTQVHNHTHGIVHPECARTPGGETEEI